MNKNSTTRSTWWSFLLYPDSLPDNWLEYLEDLHLSIALSPLHDKDTTKDDTGAEILKKPHYHGLIQFDSLKSRSQVEDILSPLNAPLPVITLSPNSYFRYFCHMDDKNKYQYNINDITYFGSFDRNFLENNASSIDIRIKMDICQFVIDNDITSISSLMSYSLAHEPEWARYLINDSCRLAIDIVKNNAYNAYLKGRDEK